MLQSHELRNFLTAEAIEDEGAKASFAENFTPAELIDEMLDTLPADVFSNPSLTWLDPAAGIGNFPIIVFERLMAGLHDTLPDPVLRRAHILSNMLFMIEIQPRSCARMADALGDSINLHQGDFLSSDWPETFPDKFDIVLGNPPYERMVDGARSAKNDNLWSKFIDAGMERLRDDGYLLYITPPAWMSPSSKQLKAWFLPHRIVHLNIQDCARWFKVGSKFSYYLIQKTPRDPDDDISFVCSFPGSKSLKPLRASGTLRLGSDVAFIPQILAPEVSSLLDKTCFAADIPKLDVIYDSDLHRFTKKHLISDTQDETFCHPLHHTPSKRVFASRPHKNQGRLKVFIPLTTYFEQAFISRDGNTQGLGYVLCDTQEEADKLLALLMTAPYRFIANITRWSNFTVPLVMKLLPRIDLDQWSLEEITSERVEKALGLNADECAFIAKCLK